MATPTSRADHELLRHALASCEEILQHFGVIAQFGHEALDVAQKLHAQLSTWPRTLSDLARNPLSPGEVVSSSHTVKGESLLSGQCEQPSMCGFLPLFPLFIMDASVKNKEATSQEAKRGPVKSFRMNEVSAAIFAREHKGKTYHSWVLTRSYRDSGGGVKYTHTLNPEDAEAVVSLVQQVSDHLRDLKAQEA